MNGIRLNFVVEGQMEEAFVKRLLIRHLADRSIWASVRCVQTSSKHNVKHRGGVVSYVQARKDLKRWMAEDRRGDVRFTTMFDLFRLPNDFPGYDETVSYDPRVRAERLQQAMRKDIDDTRLIPYVQLYEFEALILADPIHLETSHPEYRSGIHRLVETVSGFGVSRADQRWPRNGAIEENRKGDTHVLEDRRWPNHRGANRLADAAYEVPSLRRVG